MTLEYQHDNSGNGAQTIERSYGVSEQAAPAWIAAASDRNDRARSASLAALAGTSVSSRFCSWMGLAGRRYVFSVYPASDCPAFCDAVLLTVVRDMAGRRRVVSVLDTGAFPEPAIAAARRELRPFGAGVDFHVHLLAASADERAATVADLAGAQA